MYWAIICSIKVVSVILNHHKLVRNVLLDNNESEVNQIHTTDHDNIYEAGQFAL